MEPIFFFVDAKENEDKVTLTKSQLEEYVKKAYEAGYKDGQNSKQYTTTWAINNLGSGPHPKEPEQPKVTEQYCDPIDCTIKTREVKVAPEKTGESDETKQFFDMIRRDLSRF